jgi:hypothetical protein
LTKLPPLVLDLRLDTSPKLIRLSPDALTSASLILMFSALTTLPLDSFALSLSVLPSRSKTDSPASSMWSLSVLELILDFDPPDSPTV